MLHKVRPNVLVLAVLVGAITMALAILLIDRLPTGITDTVLALIVGVGLGGLVGTMGQVAQDPPPPTVPADVHERLMQSRRRGRGEKE